MRVRQGLPCLAAAFLACFSTWCAEAQVVRVDPAGPVRSIRAALATARPRTTIIVGAGIYREGRLRIDKSVTLAGEPGAILDGEGQHTVLEIGGDSITVRGLVVRNTGMSQTEDRAGILASGARWCRIEQIRSERNLFGIYLANSADCVIDGNTVIGSGTSQTLQGNGIQVWQSERITVSSNVVTGHRDGIYFEFVTNATVAANESRGNERYGMHFMFSNDCRYERNVFRANGSGVAVMYSHRVAMIANTFERNWGSAAYGLLLKDISDSEIRDNRFLSNSTGLYLEDSNRNQVTGNEFTGNGWALKLLASAQDNRMAHNAFAGNTFDVSTNSRHSFSTFENNYWDRYRGYDLDRNGTGDVPFAPVRLFALIVEQSPASLMMLRSPLVDALDLVERVLPVLTPAEMVDRSPLMRPPVGGASR
ncbi:MAG: putative ABC transporter binding protein NosD [Gemmatimonadaceae bacterium]|nr:putative ABC transporter binding protein NosD [Gemmatimonadaceae bacterium]